MRVVSGIFISLNSSNQTFGNRSEGRKELAGQSADAVLAPRYMPRTSLSVSFGSYPMSLATADRSLVVVLMLLSFTTTHQQLPIFFPIAFRAFLLSPVNC